MIESLRCDLYRDISIRTLIIYKEMLSHVQAGFQARNLEHLIEGKVTYSSLETKTIDDYNVKLLKSENQILKKNSRKPFVGSDDAENHDINNGGWKKNFTQKLRERNHLAVT
ncbi:uncharacterized protein isoform X2 [Rhodnius prolixus]|uniref:uncharacterized protein isoform X2 n=1 Tax=Rhodnius prolixus TaxID=13249 RepID=UPI003D187AB1